MIKRITSKPYQNNVKIPAKLVIPNLGFSVTRRFVTHAGAFARGVILEGECERFSVEHSSDFNSDGLSLVNLTFLDRRMVVTGPSTLMKLDDHREIFIVSLINVNEGLMGLAVFVWQIFYHCLCYVHTITYELSKCEIRQ